MPIELKTFQLGPFTELENEKIYQLINSILVLNFLYPVNSPYTKFFMTNLSENWIRSNKLLLNGDWTDSDAFVEFSH
jgi:hypothetical protein